MPKIHILLLQHASLHSSQQIWSQKHSKHKTQNKRVNTLGE